MAKQKKNELKRPDLSPEEKAVWDHVTTHAAGRIQPEDSLALETLCRSFVALQASLDAIRREPVTKLPNGTSSASQHLKIVNVLRREVGEGFARFGLSPMARVKGKLDSSEEDEQERAFAAEFD